MKRIVLIAVMVLLSGAVARAETPFSVEVSGGVPYLIEFGTPQGTGFYGTDRKRMSLDGEWRFRVDPGESGLKESWQAEYVDDSLWGTLSVPGVWQTQDPNLRYYDGMAWYRTTFQVPADVPASGLFLKFEGVFLFAKVWLNGKLLGEHEGGYTPFRFDISRMVKEGGDNILVVSCDNRLRRDSVPPRSESGVFSFLSSNIGPGKSKTGSEDLAWWPYGGIHGSVYLESVPQINVLKVVAGGSPTLDGGNLNIEGVVWNQSSAAAKVTLQCRLTEAREATTEEEIASKPCGDLVVPPKGRTGFRYTTSVSGVKQWSPSQPNLYLLDVQVSSEGQISDTVRVQTGFRTFAARNGKLELNGAEIFIYGINRHEDDPAVGLAQTPTVIENDLDMIQDLGANFIRPAHYPAHPAFLDECDKRGILLMEEIPLTRASGSQLNDPEVRSRAMLQLMEMIERDINHPSIVMWSLGSDVWSFVKSAGDMASELKLAARRMDLARPVTMGLLVVPHLTNRRDFIAPELDVLFVNEYFGWLYGENADAIRYLDFIHNSYPNKPIVIGEFGAQALLGYRDSARRRYLSEDSQADYMLAHMKTLTAKSYVAGLIPFAFSDFRSPLYTGRESYPYMSLFGLVDQRRMPKKAFSTVRDFYKELLASRGKGG